MKVIRLEYAPMSTGVRSVSAATMVTSRGSQPSSSAQIWQSSVLTPWPMSLAPLKTVTRPDRSSFSSTPLCGMSFG